jgi:2-keto-myo-inositol isomerase
LKLGFNEGTTKMNADLQTDLLLADRYGYDYIEFRMDKLEKYLDAHTVQELVQALQACRIKPHAINALKDINMMSLEQRVEAESQLEWACSVGQRIGSPCVVLVPTVDDALAQEYSRTQINQECIERLHAFTSIAARHGVGLALEPVGMKASAVRSLEQALEIVRAVGRPEVGLAIDLFNLYLFDAWRDVERLRQVDPKMIFVVHIADAENRPLSELDQHSRVWPGEGVVPIGKVLSLLRAIHYEGAASLELFRPEYWRMAAEDVVRIGKEKLAGVLGMGNPQPD